MELRTVSMESLLIKDQHRDVFKNCEIFYRCKNEKKSFGKKAKKPKKRKRIAITLVRATHRFIQGSRLLAHRISVQRTQWEDGAELNLFR